MIESATIKIELGESLSINEAADVIGAIMDGAVDNDAIARLLTALHQKGETVPEVAGAAMAMRQRMTPIHSSRSDLIDTCGTGGDCSGTFNISTAAALVAAAAGASVAKHGNRAATSRSGSADVLAALGVNVEANVACVEACLDELGICFCFAPLMHAAMRRVATVRRQLGAPTIFNILGPLANPASAPFQLLGVGRAELQPLLAESLTLLGIRRALVVHGDDGLDEVTLFGKTVVLEAAGDKTRQFEWRPADFGIAAEVQPPDRKALLVSGPTESAAIIRSVLVGQHGVPRDIVLMNAAAALYTVGLSATPTDAVSRAAEAIDSGAARALLAKLVERTNRV